MKFSTVIVFACVWFVLWEKNVCVAENSEIATSPDSLFLEFLSTGERKKAIKFTENEIISVVVGDVLRIKCTTRNVHLWEGVFHYQKFIREIVTIQRNSSGYFTSFVNIQIRPTSSFSNLSPLACKEIGGERSKAKCISLHPKRATNSDNSTKDDDQTLSVTVDECPEVVAEQYKVGFPSQAVHKKAEDSPTWLYDLQNDTVNCQVQSPTKMSLQSTKCEKWWTCYIHMGCTIGSCPSAVEIASEGCGNECYNLKMETKKASGKLECQVNGLKSHLNYILDTNGKRCFYESSNIPPCPVLELFARDSELVDGVTTTFHGRASKFTIIQSPEVFIIFKDGKSVRLDVHVLPELQNKTTDSYYTFKMVANLSLDMHAIKVIGYRYDTWKPIIEKRDFKVETGLFPEIKGLPPTIGLYEEDVNNFISFRVSGRPTPQLSLHFNGEEIKGNDRRFVVYKTPGDGYTLQIKKQDERQAGVLHFTATNLIGNYERFIKYEANWNWPRSLTEFLCVGGAFLVLVLYLLFVYSQRPRESDETEPLEDSD